MKKKTAKRINNTAEILNFLINTSKFKTVICFGILLGIYGSLVLGVGMKSYFLSILNAFQFPTFNVIFFMILFINTLSMCRMFDEYDFYIIRLKTKKNHLRELIKIVTYSNIIVIFVIIFSYLMLLNISKFQYIIPGEYNGYVSEIVFSVFYLCRYVILSILIGIISIIGYHKFKEKKIVVLNLLFLAGFWIFSEGSLTIKESFSILPWHYFQNINYGGFMLEFNYSVIFILILEILIVILYNLVNKRIEKIKKYIILNDFSFLIKKKYKMLLLQIFLPVLTLLVVTLKMQSGSLNILKMTLGLNVTRENITIINVIMLSYIMVNYILYSIYLFSRDIKGNLDNIFLRMNPQIWYKSKMLFITIATIILKLIQYLLIIGVIYLSGHSDIIQKKLVILFISDYLITLLIQQITIFIYLNINYMKKCKYIIIIAILVILFIIPKDISAYNNYHIVLLICNLIIYIIGLVVCKKNKNKMIQAIGGK